MTPKKTSKAPKKTTGKKNKKKPVLPDYMVFSKDGFTTSDDSIFNLGLCEGQLNNP